MTISLSDLMDENAFEKDFEIDEGEHRKLALESGAISYKALQKAKDMIKPGVKLIDVANALESFVTENGFDIAFPANISINEQAAHYTPSFEDVKTFGENDIIKLDFGAGKHGVLADCAVTIDLSGNNQKLADASYEALQNAISSVKAGVEVREIGREIERVAAKYGFKPIKNLGGHGVGIHDLHSSPFIPNYDNGDNTELEEGTYIAIEPFLTTQQGRGMVINGDIVEIYAFSRPSGVRQSASRTMLEAIQDKYQSEPFALRWLSGMAKNKFELYLSIGELLRAGAIEPFPVLVEGGNGIVAQSEAEMLVTKDGCEVLTK